jgi:protein-L-isoaspartate(D-aspartate) O-methyltransferase
MLDHVDTFARANVFERRKRELIAELRSKGITNEAVLQAFLTTPREEFLPPALCARAYDNVSLPIGSGQTISQPYTVAYMTELLFPRATSPETYAQARVLEIGLGSGYQTAILWALGVRNLYSVERVPELYEAASHRLRRLGVRANLKIGDGSLGWAEEAPFDAIIVTAGAPDVPESLARQLSPRGGTMVTPVGERSAQKMYRITRIGAGEDAANFTAEEFHDFRFVPLIGKEGWSGDALDK